MIGRRLSYVGVAAAAAGLALAGVSAAAPPIAAGLVLLAVAVGRTTGSSGALRAGMVAAVVLVVAGGMGVSRLEAIDGAGSRLHDGQPVAGVAYLMEAPTPGPFGQSVALQLTSGAVRGTRLLARLPREATLPPTASAGVQLRTKGVFRRPVASDEGFDLVGHLRRQGVAGELIVEKAQATGRVRGGLSGAVDGIRARADRAIGSGLPPTAAAIARGMVLGADEAIPRGARDDFRDAGLSHLLAASGQNVMLLVALAVPLLMAAGVSASTRTVALLGLIALYVPLAGAGPSIQRAGVMGAASLLAVTLSRPASRWYALGLAACVTLALNPRAFGGPGWQLSFVAVAGILSIAPGIRGSLAALPGMAAEGVAITVAAGVATAPLLAYHFGSVPLAGVVANVVALPLVAPIMWAGMLRAALGQAGSLGGPAGVVVGAVDFALGVALEPLVGGMGRLAALFADAPGGQLRLGLEHPAAVVVAYCVLFAAVMNAKHVARRLGARASTATAYVRRLPRARRVALALAAVLTTVLVLAQSLSPPGAPATLTFTFLDVGQGDATLIQHPDGSAVLFDGGPPEGGVARLLRRAGVRRLSALVMTHSSRDHHGGLAEVVARFPVDVLVDGGDGTRDPTFRAVVSEAAARGARVVDGRAPLALRVGSLRIDVLSPPPRSSGPAPEDPNPRAVVAIVSSGGFELFLSGDAESDALLGLPLPDVDAMKVPHHGSADPGLGEVLDRLRPEAAAIPVGENGYGHPAPSTLSALRRAAVPTWRTDRNGSVRLVVAQGAMTVEPDRGEAVEAGP